MPRIGTQNSSSDTAATQEENKKMNNSNEKLRVLSKILPIGVGILGFQGQRL